MYTLQSVGQLGSVQGVSNDGNVAVLMKTRLWTFNPLCLRPAERGEEQEVSSESFHHLLIHLAKDVIFLWTPRVCPD